MANKKLVIGMKILLDLIHTHVCGPFKVTSLGDSKYYVSFIDDFSRRIFIYTLHSTENGVAERVNRTLVEMALPMLVHSELATNLWAETVNTAAYLRNRCTTKILGDKNMVWMSSKRAAFKDIGIYCCCIEEIRHTEIRTERRKLYNGWLLANSKGLQIVRYHESKHC